MEDNRIERYHMVGLRLCAFSLFIAHGVKVFKVSKTRAVSLVIKRQILTTKKFSVERNDSVV